MPLSLAGTSTSPTRDASVLAAPASLPASVVAANEARRRQASAGFEEAAIRGTSEQGRIQADKIMASTRLASDYQNQRMGGLRQLGSIGQARSPRFADRLRRDLLERELQQRGELARQTTMQMGSVEELINAARRQRDRQLLDIEGEEVLQRTLLERVFTPPVYGGA